MRIKQGKIEKYPKYSREQNLRCKLADCNIAFIQEYYEKGDKEWGQRALGRKFNVSHGTIRHWVDEEFRVAGNIYRRNRLKLYGNKRNTKEDTKKFLIRKRNVLPEEMRTFELARHREYVKKHPEYNMKRAKWMKEYRKLKKDKLCQN